MRVAFFGTSDRSRPILEALDENFDLKLCVTKVDRKVGRHRELQETLVKKWAKAHNISVFEIESFKNPATQKALLKEIGRQKIDLIVVADFGFIIPKTIIESLKDKIINIHFSLLPKYRGANPVQAAIINGDEKTGISYLLMVEKMDAGPLLYQSKYPLGQTETTGELYKTLFKKAAHELPKVLKNYYKSKITPKPQDESKATYHYSPSHPKSSYIYKEDARIDWEETPKQIERKIRAFHPWPVAWTTLEELENTTKTENITLKSGVNKNLTIKIYSAQIKDKVLMPEKVQVQGKKLTNWESFKNGYTAKK